MTEVTTQAMRYHREIITPYVRHIPSEPWRRELTCRGAAGRDLAGTRYNGGPERLLSSPLDKTRANDMWERKAKGALSRAEHDTYVK